MTPPIGRFQLKQTRFTPKNVSSALTVLRTISTCWRKISDLVRKAMMARISLGALLQIVV